MPMRVSLLDDVPILSRSPVPPAPPQQWAQQDALFERIAGQEVGAAVEDGLEVWDGGTYFLGELLAKCPQYLRPIANQLATNIVDKPLPLDEVVELLAKAPGAREAQGKQALDDIGILRLMGFEVRPRRETAVAAETPKDAVRHVKVYVDGVEESVEVDSDRGPVWYSENVIGNVGNLYKGQPEFVGYTGSNDAHRAGKKLWPGMTRTERETVLIMVAKHQIALRKRAEERNRASAAA